MTVSEFRAWLEGYEAGFRGPPSEDQWQAVKTKLATVIDSASPVSPGLPWYMLNPLTLPAIPQNTPAPGWWQNPVIGQAMGDFADASAVYRVTSAKQ